MSAALLSVDNLAVEYHTARGAVRAVDGASFSVPEGSITGLVGESGCGKTTAARAITGVIAGNARITSGALVFKGRDLIAGGEAEWRKARWREIAFVPQSAMNSLNPVHRVGAQIEEVLVHRGGLRRAGARARARELFELVGRNASRLVEYPHQFSGGMRQRVAIALALALNPGLVIADEPVTALDVIVQRQVLDMILELQQRLQLSMILVTHDISVVAYVCDRIVVMYAGQVVEDGAARDVLEAPLHPYTMGLTNAFPDLERAGGELVPIEGSPPDLIDPPPGCRFAPRCPFAETRCHSVPPPREMIGGRGVSCHRAFEAEALRGLAQLPETWKA